MTPAIQSKGAGGNPEQEVARGDPVQDEESDRENSDNDDIESTEAEEVSDDAEASEDEAAYATPPTALAEEDIPRPEGEWHVVARKKKRKNIISSPCSTHNLFTHFPKDPECEICQMTKTSRARCSNNPDPRPDSFSKPKFFGDAITADHKILNEENQTRDADQHSLIVQDGATYWLQGFPVKEIT